MKALRSLSCRFRSSISGTRRCAEHVEEVLAAVQTATYLRAKIRPATKAIASEPSGAWRVNLVNWPSKSPGRRLSLMALAMLSADVARTYDSKSATVADL
jgi:hypothetical protein